MMPIFSRPAMGSLLARFELLKAPEYRWIWLLVAAGLFFAVRYWPIEAIPDEGQGALATFVVAVFLWSTNAVPMAVTGLAVLFLLPISGALSHDATYAYFGNHAVFFILGAFILASPVMRSGLSTRLAIVIISRFGQSQLHLVWSILWIAALMSFVISEHAVVAMLFPIVIEIVRATGARPGSRFGVAAFLALAWGAIIGGTATLLGGARAPLALGVLQQMTGKSVSFVDWMLACLPLVVVLLLLCMVLTRYMIRNESISLKKVDRYLKVKQKALGSISRREVLTAGIMGLTVLLWVVYGQQWGLDTIAFLGVLLMFVFQVVNWQEVEEDVNWGIFVMYGSAIALSAALRDTGMAEMITDQMLTGWSVTPILAFLMITILAMVLTEAMSNSAAVAVLMPVALAMTVDLPISAEGVTVGIALSSGLAFLLPVSTPALAIVAGSGFLRVTDVLKHGIILKFFGFIGFLLLSSYYWPLIGLGSG